MSKWRAIRDNPHFPWLWPDDPGGVETFLRGRSWIEPSEEFLGCCKAGEGNMNLTLRVRTSRRSVVLKQARPWVEKYENIAAPWDRMNAERLFYDRIAGVPEVASRSPELLASDEGARAILLEDLAPCRDLFLLYSGGRIENAEIDDLASYLRSLHEAATGADLAGFENRSMRELNHAHIFDLPLSASEGLDLDAFEPGLARAASVVRSDASLRRRVDELGREYLSNGPCLVHGDFFPGSWLRSERGLFVIDAEFSHAGRPEYDLGVATAHFVLCRQPAGVVRRLLERYREDAPGRTIDDRLVAAYAGAEILRRLIGVAQLPIPNSTGLRAELLRRAARILSGNPLETLWE